MSQKELDRIAVLALRRSGQITQVEAAKRLGVTVRCPLLAICHGVNGVARASRRAT
jgi:hypothetical protein